MGQMDIFHQTCVNQDLNSCVSALSLPHDDLQTYLKEGQYRDKYRDCLYSYIHIRWPKVTLRKNTQEYYTKLTTNKYNYFDCLFASVYIVRSKSIT